MKKLEMEYEKWNYGLAEIRCSSLTSYYEFHYIFRGFSVNFNSISFYWKFNECQNDWK